MSAETTEIKDASSGETPEASPSSVESVATDTPTSGVERSPSDPLSAVKGIAHSDIGKKREENQDSFGIIESPHFKIFAVADGMGGVKGGAIASSLAVNVFRDLLQDKSTISPEAISDALEVANSQIHQKGLRELGLSGMGTTFVGLTFFDTSMIVTNVGDSRAYRFRAGKVTQLTEDHTLVTELVRQGAITAEQAINHPVSHMLTRSLGPTPEIMVDCALVTEPPVSGDVYLLCSDGLYNLVGEDEMLAAAETHPIETLPQIMIDLANERGGTDNITVIAIEIAATYPRTLADVIERSEASATGEQLHISAESNRSAASEEPAAREANPEIKEKIALDSLSQADRVAAESSRERSAEFKVNPFGQEVEDDEPAADSEKTAAKPSTGRTHANVPRPNLMFAALIVLGIGIGGGIILSKAMQQHPQPAPREVAVVVPPPKVNESVSLIESGKSPEEGGVGRAGVGDASDESTETSATKATVSSRTGDNDGSSSHSLTHQLSQADHDSVVRRRDSLKTLIRELDEKVNSFDRPFSGNSGRLLSDAAQEREKLQNELEEVRSKIEVATRRLTIWFGRRRRLQDSDPVNMASEIAVSSPEVKDKKEQFEKATWAYLKESESLSYNPSDENLQRTVQDLITMRKQKMNDLIASIRQAIDQAVGESDRQISELTLERDRIDGKLARLKREVIYVRVLMGNDKVARDAKRKEFVQDRAAAQAELNELIRLLPEETPAAATETAAAPVTDEVATSEKPAESVVPDSQAPANDAATDVAIDSVIDSAIGPERSTNQRPAEDSKSSETIR